MEQRVVDLADPDVEPSDEELAGLMARAFAGTSAAHASAMTALRSQIAAARAEALARLERSGASGTHGE
jgi:hypothetical protein